MKERERTNRQTDRTTVNVGSILAWAEKRMKMKTGRKKSSKILARISFFDPQLMI